MNAVTYHWRHTEHPSVREDCFVGDFHAGAVVPFGQREFMAVPQFAGARNFCTRELARAHVENTDRARRAIERKECFA